MLIRRYRLSKRPPVGAVLALAGEITSNWHQSCALPDNLKAYFLSQVPQYKTLSRPSVILHTTSGSIEEHRDFMARSVFLFPIRYTKTTQLYVGSKQVFFEPRTMYRFNDHNFHGLLNPRKAHVTLVTVSYD